jgi:phosphoribosylformylglycinamidine (FGAM) synthase-like enzyme
MVLDTLSTHVLTLHSYLSLDGAAVMRADAAHERLAAELELSGVTSDCVKQGNDHGKSALANARIQELLRDKDR